MKKSLHKQRKTTRAGLIRKLDKLVSQYIINRDKKCVICGSKEQLTNGHVFSRRHLATRFEIVKPGNCFCQCWPCNYKHVRDPYPYYNWFIKKYGQTEFDSLYARWNTVTKLTTTQLQQMIGSLEI